MYCVLFLTSVWLTFGRVGPLYANKFIASANILLFAVCTTHFGITFNGFYNILVSASMRRCKISCVDTIFHLGKYWG